MAPTSRSAPKRRRSSDSPLERLHAADHVLMEEVSSIVDKIVAAQIRRNALPEQERDDLRSEILLKVIVRLNELANDSGEPAIHSVGDYVAVVAFNSLADYIRRLHPARAKLKARVRYATARDSGLSLWMTPRGPVLGLTSWAGTQASGVPEGAAAELRAGDVSACLHYLFEATGHPLLLDDVVGLMARVEGIPDSESPAGLLDRTLFTPGRSVDDALEERQYLERVWTEVQLLPLRQRVALLLHARDASGESVVRLLAATIGVGFDELVQALGLTADALAGLWDALPLDDTSIASRLGVERQQVINLRRAARERLVRRVVSERSGDAVTPRRRG
jgi:hypothetical protein